MRGIRGLLGLALLATVAASGCSGGGADARPTVSVLYAGSLVHLMEHRVGPVFERGYGDGYSGFGAGSSEIASEIASRTRTGDVFISASPAADRALMGSSGGNWVRWWVTFATAPLVIAYNRHSRYAADFQSKPWYQVITEPGIRIGRTDPKLDPKGQLTMTALHQAQQTYHLSGFAAKVAAGSQVFPEEELLGRMSAGQLDAGFFYSNEAVPAHLPTVPLGGVHAAATFTATVLNRAPHPAAAGAFVHFLLTAEQPDVRHAGLHLQTPTVGGDRAAVPDSLRPLLRG